MNIVENMVQGTAAWHELRAQRFTASEAAAALGQHKYMSRSDLLKLKHTGVQPEISASQQRIFDAGHQAEASARPYAEEIIGSELYPCTVEDDSQTYLASMDGLDMLCETGFEHKLASEGLLEQVRHGDLDDHYKWQMDHQMMVTGAKRILFMASDGGRERCAYLWYERDEKRIEQLLAGWKQFDADLKAYQPTDETVRPAGQAPDSLPALSINIAGGVQASNLPDFKAAALKLIEGIKTELVTDQDFSDAESATKWLQKGEKQLQASKQAALQQTADINALFQTIDELAEQMRQKRLTLEKLVKAEKTNRRNQIQRDAELAFHEWLIAQGSPCAVTSTLDVPGAMKGKKTIASLLSAADDEVARAKVAASQEIERLKSNDKLLADQSEGYEFLFSDRLHLIAKAPDDLAATIKARIAEHKEAERQRLEAERERIRKEEEQRAAAKAAEEARQAEQARQREAAAETAKVAEAARAAATPEEDAPIQTHSPSQDGPGYRPPIDTSRLNAAADSFQRGSQMAKPAEVTISRKEYDQLLADQSRLYALLNAGVEQWSGYQQAMEKAA